MLRLHPAFDSGAGRHVGRFGRGAGPRRARHGLPAGAERTADGLAAQAALRRVGDHAVQRGRPPAAAAHRQGAGAGFGRGLGRTLRRPDDPAGRRLCQQLLAFRQALPDLHSGRPRLPHGQTLARQLLRRLLVGRKRPRLVAGRGRGYRGRRIRLAVQPLPFDRTYGHPRGPHLDDDRHAGHHPHGRAGTARRRRHGMERHLLSGSQRFEDRRTGLPAGAGLRVPCAGGPVRIVGAAAGDSDERSRGGAGRRALHRRLTPAQRFLRQ